MALAVGQVMAPSCPWALAERRRTPGQAPQFGIKFLKETGTVSGVVTGWWGLLGIPGRDKEAGPV